MELLILIVAMVVVGLIMGAVAGLIWKENLPLSVQGIYVVAVITAVITGLLDWYVIPAMGFSDTIKWIGIATEPALAVLAVIWIIKKAKQ